MAPCRLPARLVLLSCLLLPLRGQSDYATPYVFTTLAGTSSIGSADGTGSAARFYQPQGVAVDPAGNLYVADSDNETIRKISPAGVVTTLAGAPGETGGADGTGSQARFNFPSSLVLDGAGNLFVADANNHTIRKVTPAGAVTTLAGAAGISGSADGTGSDARFHRPEGIAIDPSGNLYIADAGNHLVRKISPAGTVSTLAGSAGISGWADGTGSTVRFSTPFRITVDPAGMLYVVEAGNRDIRKITPAGTVTTYFFWDAYAYITGYTSSHNIPAGIAIGATGKIYFTDGLDNTICEISAAGVVTTLAGTDYTAGSTDGRNADARFNNPVGLAIDVAGNLFVADRDNNAIRRISPGGDVTTMGGLGMDGAYGNTDGPGTIARFSIIAGVAVGPAGELYVCDSLNHTVRKISPSGEVTTLAGMAGTLGSADGLGGTARFNEPVGLAVDHAGNIFVTDSGSFTIRKISPAGNVTTLAGLADAPGMIDATGANARFGNLQGIAIDPAGNLYARDSIRIRKITPGGTVTTLNAELGLSSNYGLAVDAAGNVYLSGDHTVRKITAGGVVTTLAGIPSIVNKAVEGYITQAYPGSTDGVGNIARFNAPEAVTLDAGGNVLVADTGNQTIRQITPDGMVTTLAGLAGAIGSTDGTGREARFYFPSGLALDPSGNLYVASGSTVRKGRPADRPPLITTQPQSQTVTTGASVTFTANASSVPAPTYQWYFNGNPFTGATTGTLSLTNVRPSDAGDYSVVATNPLGTVASNKATLSITAGPASTPAAIGGGGAIESWFILALLALGATQRLAASSSRSAGGSPHE